MNSLRIMTGLVIVCLGYLSDIIFDLLGISVVIETPNGMHVVSDVFILLVMTCAAIGTVLIYTGLLVKTVDQRLAELGVNKE